MSPAFIEFIGSAAACLTTASFFPQAVKVVRERKTAGLSLTMYLLLVTGVAMWMAYGIFIGSWPLIIANAISIIPQLAILFLLLWQIWIDRFAGNCLQAATVAAREDAAAAIGR